ncbi:MAG TPA: outer membrane beta-barrel protein [Candidatus Binatia bacterium]|nr:outer membrane beta-barrel protein [Candidatus Binatia bacterium]
MRPKVLSAVVLFVLLSCLSGFSQQSYVSRFDAFTGYSFFSTPSLNLFENGFNGEFGVNVNTWLALGGDFSVFTGDTSITPNMLSSRVQQQLAGGLALLDGLVPPGYRFAVPINSTTYTYSAGPQINIRKMEAVTIFVRPALGALHESVSLRPTDPLTKGLVQALVGSNMHKTDTIVFYGFGGGLDFNLSQHFAVRTAADFVHYDLFSGLLNGGRNSVRFSVGPTFRFGENVVKK